MKHKENDNTIQVYPGIYSVPFYELECWKVADEIEKKDALKYFKSHQLILCNIERFCTGMFQTKKQALRQIDEMYDETDCDYIFLLREKPQSVMMPHNSYVKEWTYVYGLLEDESLTNNYATNDCHFHGRPKEMIRCEKDEMVVVLGDTFAYWGVVDALPHVFDDTFKGNWQDDCYWIDNASKPVPAQRVIRSVRVPQYVKVLLKERQSTLAL